jgi:hypothetical protein
MAGLSHPAWSTPHQRIVDIGKIPMAYPIFSRAPVATEEEVACFVADSPFHTVKTASGDDQVMVRVDLALYASNKAMAEITDSAGKKIAVRAIVNFVAWLCQCGVPKTLEEPLKGEWPAS